MQLQVHQISSSLMCEFQSISSTKTCKCYFRRIFLSVVGLSPPPTQWIFKLASQAICVTAQEMYNWWQWKNWNLSNFPRHIYTYSVCVLKKQTNFCPEFFTSTSYQSAVQTAKIPMAVARMAGNNCVKHDNSCVRKSGHRRPIISKIFNEIMHASCLRNF